MNKKIEEIYLNQINFLIKLKMSVSAINNQLHDNLALFAVEKLQTQFSDLTIKYVNAGTSGYDIKGFNNKNEIELICEVKTTLPNSKNKLEGQQKKAIEKDLERLEQAPNIKHKFLVLLSSSTKEAIEKQVKLNDFPNVQLINALQEEFYEND